MWKRLFFLAALAATGGYLYYSNWFVKLDARLGFNSESVTILARESDYTGCRIRLAGGYSTKVERIYQSETRIIPLYDFSQWNGTRLEAAGQLDKKVNVAVWCNEGRASAEFHNPSGL